MTAETRARSHLQNQLDRLGFSEDFVPSFNLKANGPELIDWIGFQPTEEHRKDLLWLANQIARIGQREKETLECRDNFRAYRQGESPARYQRAKQHGCCGFYDQTLTNPQTGNTYRIGFNYGH